RLRGETRGRTRSSPLRAGLGAGSRLRVPQAARRRSPRTRSRRGREGNGWRQEAWGQIASAAESGPIPDHARDGPGSREISPAEGEPSIVVLPLMNETKISRSRRKPYTSVAPARNAIPPAIAIAEGGPVSCGAEAIMWRAFIR